MLEVINELSPRKFQEIDNFLSYLGIYEDRKRYQALTHLLRKESRLIRGKIGIEAGAGLGIITEFLIKLGAGKVYAVEENDFCFNFLKEKFKKIKKVEVVHEKIERFCPASKIDFLFQELYGPVLLDESLLALDRIRFKPEVVIPNAGLILVEELRLKDLNDPILDKKVFGVFKGVLVTDLFPKISFKNPQILGRWEFGAFKRNYSFRYKIINNKTEVIALGMEIWHRDRRIIGTRDSFNWPYIFTPRIKDTFEISFIYSKGYTKIYFRWI